MKIFIESGEFDPSLKSRIAAFIDAFFEDEDSDGGFAAWGESARAPEPSEPCEPPADEPSHGAGVFGRLLHQRRASSKQSAAAVFEDEDGIAVQEAATVDHAVFGGAVLADAAAAPRDAVMAGAAPVGGAGDLKSWLDQIDEPFSTTLLALIDRKGLADADVYKRANMSRQLFSRIRSDAAYRPAKKTVLALSIALELTLDEMRDLLARAGFALSRSNKRDVIVEYFVTNGIYDLFSINEALYEFDQPLI